MWKAELAPEQLKAVNLAVLAKLADLRKGRPDLKKGESWQSDQSLDRLPEFAPLVLAINAAADELFRHLTVVHQGFAITGCWANVNAPGATHSGHMHPNNFLSGVYYVQTVEGAATINFHDPRSQTGIVRPPIRVLTADNADQVVIQIGEGTLLLFPAWLQHSVDENRSAAERISIGFNIMFSDYAETMGRPAWSSGERPRDTPHPYCTG